MHHGMHYVIRGQLVEVCSLLPSCEFWQSNSGLRAWQQVSLPRESSYQHPQTYSLQLYFWTGDFFSNFVQV